MGFFDFISTVVDPGNIFGGRDGGIDVGGMIDPGGTLVEAATGSDLASQLADPAGLIGSLSGEDAAEAAINATQTTADATSRSIAFQREWLSQNRADILEAVDAGLIDLQAGFEGAYAELAPFMGLEAQEEIQRLLSDPGSVMTQPGVQEEFERGIGNLQAAVSTESGGGPSGRGIVAATEYGQNFASAKLDEALGRVEPFADLSQNVRSNVANLYSGLGTSTSNLRSGAVTGMANLTGTAGQNIAGTLASSGQNQASGIINAANATVGGYQNFANLAAQGAALFS